MYTRDKYCDEQDRYLDGVVLYGAYRRTHRIDNMPRVETMHRVSRGAHNANGSPELNFPPSGETRETSVRTSLTSTGMPKAPEAVNSYSSSPREMTRHHASSGRYLRPKSFLFFFSSRLAVESLRSGVDADPWTEGEGCASLRNDPAFIALMNPRWVASM